MCLGSGSCTRMPCTPLSALSRAISASNSASVVSARQAMIEARHAELGRDLALAAHIDLARRIVADQHRRQARLGPALGDQLGRRPRRRACAGRPRTPCRRSVSLQPSPSPAPSPSRDPAASRAGSPAMLNNLVARRGTARHLEGRLRQPPVAASSSMTAALALPSSAGAVTGAFSAPPLHASVVRRARGWTRSFDRHAHAGAAQECRIACHKR